VEGRPHGDIYQKFDALHGVHFLLVLYIGSLMCMQFAQLGHSSL
jgi:hypothetical protein